MTLVGTTSVPAIVPKAQSKALSRIGVSASTLLLGIGSNETQTVTASSCRILGGIQATPEFRGTSVLMRRSGFW